MVFHGIVHRFLPVANFVRVDRESLEEFVEGDGFLEDCKIFDLLLNLSVLKNFLERVLETTRGMSHDALLNAMFQELPSPTLLTLRRLRSGFHMRIEPVLHEPGRSNNHSLEHTGPRGRLPEVCDHGLEDLLVELGLLLVDGAGRRGHALLLRDPLLDFRLQLRGAPAHEEEVRDALLHEDRADVPLVLEVRGIVQLLNVHRVENRLHQG